jgi:DNA primase
MNVTEKPTMSGISDTTGDTVSESSPDRSRPDVESVKRHVGIDILLEYYGGDVPSGRGWRSMVCPFHGDTVASASINLDEDRFRCHGCDVGGDVVDVVRTIEGLGFKEALEWFQRVFDISSTSGESTRWY